MSSYIEENLDKTRQVRLLPRLHFRARRTSQQGARAARLSVELATVLLVTLTGHIGGFLSGINGPGQLVEQS